MRTTKFIEIFIAIVLWLTVPLGAYVVLGWFGHNVPFVHVLLGVVVGSISCVVLALRYLE